MRAINRWVVASTLLFLSLECMARTRDADAVPQQLLARLMAGKEGAIALLDVSSGKLLSHWRLDVAAKRLSPPGSTVKPFVLIDLLRSGKVQPDQRLVCRRVLQIDGRQMNCSHSPSITNLDAAEAIAFSCNSYFAAIATRLNASELTEIFQRAGFASLTGFAQNEAEAAGRIASAKTPAQLQLQSMGSWGIEVTPLALLRAYRTLALKRQSDSSGPASAVFVGLENSVRYGMAQAAQPTGVSAAGKTGTAADPKTGQTHGFFAGYSPADKPEIVLVIYLEHGRGRDAAAIAAPIFTSYRASTHRGKK